MSSRLYKKQEKSKAGQRYATFLTGFVTKVLYITASWELWKHPDPVPGGRPMFFKAKLPKESKNGFKTISCRRYPVMFFSKNYFWHQKSSKNWTFCWFFEILSMCISKTSSKKMISGLPESVKKLQKYWKLYKKCMWYFSFLKHQILGKNRTFCWFFTCVNENYSFQYFL